MLLTSSKMFERYIFLSLLLSHRININQEKKTPKFMDSVFFFDRFKNLTTRSHYMPRKKTDDTRIVHAQIHLGNILERKKK